MQIWALTASAQQQTSDTEKDLVLTLLPLKKEPANIIRIPVHNFYKNQTLVAVVIDLQITVGASSVVDIAFRHHE